MKDFYAWIASFLAYDIKMEKGDQWVTLSNGSRIMIDAEGTVKAGYHGFLGKKVSDLKSSEKGGKPLTVTSKQRLLHPKKKLPDATKYIEARWSQLQKTEKDESGKPLTERKARERAAREYFRNNLQGCFVETTVKGKPAQVHFTGKTWSEFFKDPNNFDVKVALLPKLPDLIRKGMKTAEYQLPHNYHKDFDGFYHIETKIPDPRDGNKKLLVIMDVGKTAKSDEDYNQYFYTARAAQDKKMRPDHDYRNAADAATVTNGSDLTTDSVPQNYEIVKIRVSPVTRGANDSFNFASWLKRRRFI